MLVLAPEGRCRWRCPVRAGSRCLLDKLDAQIQLSLIKFLRDWLANRVIYRPLDLAIHMVWVMGAAFLPSPKQVQEACLKIMPIIINPAGQRCMVSALLSMGWTDAEMSGMLNPQIQVQHLPTSQDGSDSESLSADFQHIH